MCRKSKKGIQGTWVLSALVGLLVLYGIAHIVAILHRKRGELQQLMKGSFINPSHNKTKINTN